MKKRIRSDDEKNSEDHKFLKSRIRSLLMLLCVFMVMISVNAVSVASSDLMVNESPGNDSNSIIIDPRENETVVETENSTQTINNDSSSVIYVNGASGEDANDGSTQDKAKKTIKNATDTVTAGGTIHIANGNYAGEENRI